MPRRNRGLDRQVSVKLTAEQVEAFKREARERRIPLAALLREKLETRHIAAQPKGD